MRCGWGDVDICVGLLSYVAWARRCVCAIVVAPRPGSVHHLRVKTQTITPSPPTLTQIRYSPEMWGTVFWSEATSASLQRRALFFLKVGRGVLVIVAVFHEGKDKVCCGWQIILLWVKRCENSAGLFCDGSVVLFWQFGCKLLKVVIAYAFE